MSDVATLTVLVNGIYNNAVAPANLSVAQRKELENAIHPVINGYRAWKSASATTYTAWEIGDELIHIDNAGKRQVMGRVVGVPFNPTTDLDNRAKFDLYQDNSPAI